MATEGTAKVRRIIHGINQRVDAPGDWLIASALKTLCQEIEAQEHRLDELEAKLKGEAHV